MEYETAVDRAIREAAERGAFDDLPGAGKPLPMRNTGDPDWWLKDLMVREGITGSELLPPAVALRREADGFPESLRDLPDEAAVRRRHVPQHRDGAPRPQPCGRRRPHASAPTP